MRTYSLIKGLPIFAQNGEKLGYVYDFCVSEYGEVLGVILQKGTILKKSLFIDLKEIISFGSDGILVTGENVLKEYENQVEVMDSILGKSLISSKGEELGIVEDVYFQEELGTIIGYECSDGFFTDISEGKRFIKVDAPASIGKDAIIVNMSQEETLSM